MIRATNMEVDEVIYSFRYSCQKLVAMVSNTRANLRNNWVATRPFVPSERWLHVRFRPPLRQSSSNESLEELENRTKESLSCSLELELHASATT